MEPRARAEGQRAGASSNALAVVRRSIVLVHGFAGTASGWVATHSGGIVTNRRALAYHGDARVDCDDGTGVDARVVWADVARDIALLLPAKRLGLPPLSTAPGEAPRLGEQLFVVGRASSKAMLFAPVVVCGIETSSGVALLRLAPALGEDTRGGAVVDAQGRAIAIVVDALRAPGYCGAVVVHALADALAIADAPVAELANRAPSYRCVSCGEPLSAEAERCLRCGVRLDDAPVGEGPGAPQRVVREILATLGVVANKARTGPCSWRVVRTGRSGDAASAVEIRCDQDGRDVSLRIPVVRVPRADHEPFYRLLLTLNDQTTEEARLGVSGDVAFLSFTEPVALVQQRDPERLVNDLVARAEHLRAELSRAYGVEPISDASPRG